MTNPSGKESSRSFVVYNLCFGIAGPDDSLTNQALTAIPGQQEWHEGKVDRARTHVSGDRNFAVGDAEASPRALQASECSELLDPTRTSYLILVQRQPGKLL